MGACSWAFNRYLFFNTTDDPMNCTPSDFLLLLLQNQTI